jgi:hypothetical protein
VKPSQGATTAEERVTAGLWRQRCSSDGDGGAPENFGSLSALL